MESLRSKKWLWVVIVSVAGLALIATSFLPYLVLLGK